MPIDPLRVEQPAPILAVGDLVRLRRDELGEIVTAKAGDWGAIVRIDGTTLDIRFAGYCRPRTASLAMATAVPAHIVEPCDISGKVVSVMDGVGKFRRWR